MIKVITVAPFDPSPIRYKRGSVLFVQIAFSLDLDHPAFDPERVAFPQNRFILEKANAEEIDVAFLRRPHLPGVFQCQTNLGQKFLDLFSRGVQLLFVRPQQHEIIDIADIILDPEFFFDEMIQVLQEEVREPLTRIKADRLPVLNCFNVWLRRLVRLIDQHFANLMRIPVAVFQYCADAQLIPCADRCFLHSVLYVFDIVYFFVNVTIAFQEIPTFLLASRSFERPTKPCSLWRIFGECQG